MSSRSCCCWPASLSGGGVSYLRQDAVAGSSWGPSLGVILAQSPRIAQQWERAIVLRLGRYAGLRGPGLFWIVPFIDQVSSWIDQRTITTSLRRRADAHLRHGAGERRRRALLDGLRPGEGGPRGAGLQGGRELGGADGAARHHRPHAADRPAQGPRADRGRAAEADRRAVEPLGRDGPVGRDARRDHPRVAPGRDVARGPGGAREGGADHPRPGRGGDRPPVRPGVEVATRATRRPCTSGP